MKKPFDSRRAGPLDRGFTRRRFLHLCGLSAASLALEDALFPALADAAAPAGKYLLFCYFSGGWDQLLALDPRDNTVFTDAQAVGVNGTGIQPAYDNVTDAETKSLLSANPSGVQTLKTATSPLTFGPAVPLSLIEHAQDLCILRGVDMGTLTHEVGRRYFITGKMPRGLAASGSALPTAVAALEGDGGGIPNLSVGVETYNETFPAYASGVQVSNAADVFNILRVLGKVLPDGTKQALADFEAADDSCRAHELDDRKLVTLLRSSRLKALDIVGSGAADHFNFTLDATKQTPEVKALFQTFNITTSSDVAGPKGQAALAAQAFTRGVAQAVSLQLAAGIDDHDDDWARTHATSLRAGFDALGRLIKLLKSTPDASGRSYWSQTTLMVFSEFARTPNLNVRGGRDHHLANSCLLAGPGIRGNRVVGATGDANRMGVQKVDFATGAVTPDGQSIRPADIHATVLKSMNLAFDHLSNQSPRVLSAILS